MIGVTSARRHARTLVPLVGLLGVLGGLGCDDNNNVVVPVLPTAVAVFKDSSFDFTTLHTFSMPDTIVHLFPITATQLSVTREFDQTAINQVRRDLRSRGYTEITNGSIRPDFVVLVGVTATTNYNAFVGYPWFSFWGFYSGWAWFIPGFSTTWGIIYPWFPTVGFTSFDQGTLIVDLIPTTSVNTATRTIRSAWTGVATALLNGDVTSVTVAAAVDRMFQLSPYLTATTP
jgi:Domain of unknown function (DUF4136)